MSSREVSNIDKEYTPTTFIIIVTVAKRGRLCLYRTAAANGPTPQPPEDMSEYGVEVE